MATPARAAAPLAGEPYRLLFPLGAAIAFAAVLPFALGGAGGGYLAAYHAVAQVEGFLTCFVLGFLFTAAVRRGGARPPAAWQTGASLALPAAAVASAWAGHVLVAHLLWLGVVAVAISFALPRLRAAGSVRSSPGAVVWIPLAVVSGVAGAALAAGAPALAPSRWLEVWTIGRGLLVQGFGTGIVLGLAEISSRAAGEAGPPRRSLGALWLHAVAALAFFASFPLEALHSPPLAMGVRAGAVTAVLLLGGHLYRTPRSRGVYLWLAWVGAWLLPVGYWAAALAPRLRTAALHIVFIGAFAQLALALSAHFVLSEGAHGARGARRPWMSAAMAALVSCAFAGRVLAGVDFRHVRTWLALGAVAFCGAVGAWLSLVLPVLRASRAPGVRPR